MAKKPSIYRTIIRVEVLSEGPYEVESLDSVAYDLDEGECVGDYTVTSKRLPASKVEAALEAVGSDSTFFDSDEDDED